MNKEDNISQLLKEKLEGLEGFVDAGQWDVLSAKLNANLWRKIFLLWSSAFIGFVSIAVFGLSVLITKQDNHQISQNTKSTISNPLVNKIEKDESASAEIQSSNELLSAILESSNMVDKAKNEEKAISYKNIEKEELPISNKSSPIYKQSFEDIRLVSKTPIFTFGVNFFTPDLLIIPGEKAPAIGHDERNSVIGKWEIGLMMTPAFADKILNSDNANGWLINKDFFGIDKKSEKSSAGFQTSLAVQRNLSNRWFVQGGLTYSEKRESVRYNHTIKDEIIVSYSEKKLMYFEAPQAQWINVSGDANNKFTFLELPLFIGFKQDFTEKCEWRIRGGLSYWRLLDKQGIKVDPTMLVLNDLAVSKNYTNSNLGFAINSGVYIKLGPAMKLLIEPGGSVSLTNLTKGTALNTRPYNYGLNIGLQYIIK